MSDPLESRLMNLLEACDREALPGFPSGPINERWMKAFLEKVETFGLVILEPNEIGLAIDGVARLVQSPDAEAAPLLRKLQWAWQHR